MIGINDMQQAWQNLGPGGSMSYSSNMGTPGFAGLQTPSAITNTQNAFSGNANIPGVNALEFPSWLSKDPNTTAKEAMGTYGQIGANTNRIATGYNTAYNNAIGYNTSAGGQAANNAATEYSNRAAQSGASSLGAGAVKAQAMMPVYAQNAALKIGAADKAAQTYQKGMDQASGLASTIGQLRSSYLSTLVGYSQGQQKLALDKYGAEQSAASAAAQAALGYGQLQAQQFKVSRESDSERRLAAMGLLSQQAPGGTWINNQLGQITSGQGDYNRDQLFKSSQDQARQALMGML